MLNDTQGHAIMSHGIKELTERHHQVWSLEHESGGALEAGLPLSRWWSSAVCSAVVESWYERQYTCLVVKRRTAAAPATSTIIVSLC